MSSIRADYDLLLEAPDPIEADLARELLQQEGIPSLMHGADRDLAEFGAVAHARLVRPSLYVPKGAAERARAILAASGHDRPLDTQVDVGEPEPETPAQPGRGREALIWLLFVLLALAVIVLTIRQYLQQDGGG